MWLNSTHKKKNYMEKSIMKNKVSILKQKQNQLIDNFILDTDKISQIMKNYTLKRKGFHNYSIGNLLLANYQLYMKHGEGIDLLAPYKKWGDVNRNVKYGEKALYILAPIFKEIKDPETDEILEKKVFFRRVPVFDLSQTEGEEFEKDYTINNGCKLTFKEIISKVNVPVELSEKQLTRGYTDGKKIWISKHISDDRKICVLFHELAHYYLHFDENRNELDSATKELEAESISFMVSSAIGIVNEESGAYITNWAGNNSHELIKGKGNKLIRTASQIIDDLGLNDEIKECA